MNLLAEMYRMIVEKRVRALFDAVNRGDAEPVLRAFAQRFEHSFLGENHALGGSRHKLATTRQWYERLYRLLPDIKFEVRRIWVSGGPWNTIVVAEWDETNSGTDGVRASNSGIHFLHLRWGRATQLTICPDIAGLKATLDRLAISGNLEAHAAPIVD